MDNVNFIAMDIVQETKNTLQNIYQNSTNDYRKGMDIVLSALSNVLKSKEEIVYLHIPNLKSEIQVDPDEINFFFNIDN